MSLRSQMIASLKSHAVGQINKHKMNVEVYLENPAGIGEHPDVMSAIEEELHKVAEYHDMLEVLEKYIES